MNEVFSPSIDGPLFRQSDPLTTKKAAAVVDVTRTRRAILAAMFHVTRAIGATSFEIASALNKDRDSVSPHMKPLENRGLIQRAGYSRKNPKTQQECEVWVLTESGRKIGEAENPPKVKVSRCPHCGGTL